MRLVFTNDLRLVRTKDGQMWSSSGLRNEHIARLRSVFDEVQLIARTKRVDTPPEGYVPLNLKIFSVIEAPYYVGPFQYLKNYRKMKSFGSYELLRSSAVLITQPSPSMLSDLFVKQLISHQHPFAVDITADPWDLFSPKINRLKVVNYFYRWYFTKNTKESAEKAICAKYVTQMALQKRYPCPRKSWGISDVVLSKSSFRKTLQIRKRKQPPVIINIGNLETPYKATEVQIEAIHFLKKRGCEVVLKIIGEGRLRPHLEKKVNDLGLHKNVVFLGRVPAGKSIMDQLDTADLFILPSFQEGLPRALLEAMARGLPCIGSRIGGIPELLAEEDMVLPGDPLTLANKIFEILENPIRRIEMSKRNLKTAKNFEEIFLNKKYTVFLKYLKAETQEWINSRHNR